MPMLAITVFDAFKGETNSSLCERFERHNVQHSRTDENKKQTNINISVGSREKNSKKLQTTESTP